MELIYTAAQAQFRTEVRDWLKTHIPTSPLPSFDTEEGFAAHREWEKTLAEGDFGMVTWPQEYGGRGCDLIEWLIFEEEYYRAGAPLRVNQNGIFSTRPHIDGIRHRGAKAAFYQHHGQRHRNVGSGMV